MRLLQGAGAVGDAVFHLGIQFGKGFGIAIGNKERIVAEPIDATKFFDDGAGADPFLRSGRCRRDRKTQRPYENGRNDQVYRPVRAKAFRCCRHRNRVRRHNARSRRRARHRAHRLRDRSRRPSPSSWLPWQFRRPFLSHWLRACRRLQPHRGYRESRKRRGLRDLENRKIPDFLELMRVARCDNEFHDS